jgi:hypothetical protein
MKYRMYLKLNIWNEGDQNGAKLKYIYVYTPTSSSDLSLSTLFGIPERGASCDRKKKERAREIRVCALQQISLKSL